MNGNSIAYSLYGIPIPFASHDCGGRNCGEGGGGGGGSGAEVGETGKVDYLTWEIIIIIRSIPVNSDHHRQFAEENA